MTRENAIKFLDRYIDLVNSANELANEYDEIETISIRESIHISSGIWAICKALGIEPKKEFRISERWNVEVTFNYRGYEIFQLCHAEVPDLDLNHIRIEPKEGESADDILELKPQGIFKDMQEVIDEFDEKTTYSHEGSGVLGQV